MIRLIALGAGNERRRNTGQGTHMTADEIAGWATERQARARLQDKFDRLMKEAEIDDKQAEADQTKIEAQAAEIATLGGALAKAGFAGLQNYKENEAQAADIARLREALEYIMDGYGLSPPDFENLPNEGDDWIVAKIRAALKASE